MSRSIFVDTSVLPLDILNYRDDEFYSIVNRLTGSEETELLRIQSIRSVNSFLRIINIFDVLNIDSEEINRIKKDVCFILNDNTYVIKPGIKASMDYLHDLFFRKQREISKNLNREYFNTSNTTSMQISTSNIVPNEQRLTTIDLVDHRSFLTQSIDEWCIKNGNSKNSFHLKLIEGSDFLISAPSTTGDFIHIRCGCRVSSKLPRQGNHFQLSNFYRHLKTGKCSMIQSKLKSNSDGDSTQITIDDEENLSSPQSSVIQNDKTSSASTAVSSIQAKRKRSSNDRRMKRQKH